MLSCPHCHFPVIGRSNSRSVTPDSTDATITCSHCYAILRVQVTTLHDPDPKKLRNLNELKPATTYCSMCHEPLPLGANGSHVCQGQAQNAAH